MKSSDKKELLVFILTIKILESKAKNINIAMISANAYCVIYYWKEAQVLAVLMKEIQYQVDKEARAETDPRSIILQEYHCFFDIFSKKNSDTLYLYRKYDHKIHLDEEQKLNYASLYKMSHKKLDAMKRYLNFYLAKRFFQASLSSYSLSVLFIKKPKEGIWFCVDYKRLNNITKKDRYLISLIEEILA